LNTDNSSFPGSDCLLARRCGPLWHVERFSYYDQQCIPFFRIVLYCILLLRSFENNNQNLFKLNRACETTQAGYFAETNHNADLSAYPNYTSNASAAVLFLPLLAGTLSPDLAPDFSLGHASNGLRFLLPPPALLLTSRVRDRVARGGLSSSCSSI